LACNLTSKAFTLDNQEDKRNEVIDLLEGKTSLPIFLCLGNGNSTAIFCEFLANVIFKKKSCLLKITFALFT
jgi:hypothetical protein